MRRLLPLVLALLASGCLGERPAPDAADQQPRPPVEVYAGTLDFSRDPSGAVQEVPVTMPAGARRFTMTVDWQGAPAGPTRDVGVALLDGEGNEGASCRLGTGAVATEGRDCGPQTNMADRGPYVLRVEGYGMVQARVVVTASFPQE